MKEEQDLENSKDMWNDIVNLMNKKYPDRTFVASLASLCTILVGELVSFDIDDDVLKDMERSLGKQIFDRTMDLRKMIADTK